MMIDSKSKYKTTNPWRRVKEYIKTKNGAVDLLIIHGRSIPIFPVLDDHDGAIIICSEDFVECIKRELEVVV